MKFFFVSNEVQIMAPPQRANMDSTFIYTVAGYIREQSNISTIDIPAAIEQICISYYLLKEEFNDCVTLRKVGPIICADLDTHIYGVEDAWILGNKSLININDKSVYKYKWKFKLHKLPSNNAIKLGISSDYDKDECQLYGYFQHIQYGQKYLMSESDDIDDDYDERNILSLHDELANDGDIIELIIDIKHLQIGLCINEEKIIYFQPNDWKNIEPDIHFNKWQYTLQIMIPPISCIECIAFSIEQNNNQIQERLYDFDMMHILYIFLGIIVLIASFWFGTIDIVRDIDLISMII